MKTTIRLLTAVALGAALVPCFCRPAFGASSLLTLERSSDPRGPWKSVPANTLSITEEGAFADTYDARAGFYRIRIDTAPAGLGELNIPLENVPVFARGHCEDLLASMRNLGGDNGWEEAKLGSIAFPIYDAALDPLVPAYLEFKVCLADPRPTPGVPGMAGFEAGARQSPAPIQRDIDVGFITVSLTRDDLPVLDYAMSGITQTERLRWLARSSAVKVFRYGDSFLAAENEKGELVAYIGAPPTRFPDAILDLCDREFEGYQDTKGGRHPATPIFKGEPYKTYEEFKKDWVQSRRFQLAREKRREQAAILWNIYSGALERNAIVVALNQDAHLFQDREVTRFVLGDPTLATVKILKIGVLVTGQSLGITTYNVTFSSGQSLSGYLAVAEKTGLLSEEQAGSLKSPGWSSWEESYAGNWDQQRRYTQEWGGSCYSGCGGTAWAMLYGWFDYTGAAANLIDGTAPLYNNSAVSDCIWYVVDHLGTYCVGNQGATNPWDMYKGYNWANHRGHGYSVSYTWSIPCFYSSGARNKARDSIKSDGRPTIIGIGCTSPHYCVAYGYKYREYKWLGVVWAREHKFKCNMGWGWSSPVWKDGDVWYGQRNNFW